MGWRESLRDANFDGVPFFVDTTEFSSGWNISERDITQPEKKSKGNLDQQKIDKAFGAGGGREADTTETSKKAKVFNVLMYFIGENYLSGRNAMLERFDNGGVGELVLPTLGKVKCFIQEFSSTFSNTEGGFETIECVFIAKPDQPQIINSIDTASALSGGILDSILSIGDSFGYKVLGVADYVFEEAENIAETLSGSVFDLIGLGGTNNTVNDYVLKIRAFEADINTIVRSPDRYYNEIQGLVSGLSGIFTDSSTKFEAQDKLNKSFGSTFKPVNQTTPNRAAQANNQDSVVFTVRALTAVEMAGAGSGIQFISVEQADTIKETTIAALDGIAEEVGDSNQRQELYDAIIDVKDKFLNDVEQNAENLPKSRDIETADLEPALVVSYDLYADEERAPEVVERNKVIHPLFCQRKLDVLSF